MDMSILSMKGRCNRKKFFWTIMAISMAGNVAAIASDTAFGETGIEPFVAQFAILALLLVSIVAISMLTVKRLHDLNRSFAHFFRLAIPVYNIYFLFILFFRKGTEGESGYGADPLVREYRKRQRN